MLDVTFDEDAARNRTDNGPENLAILRRLTLNLLRTAKPQLPSAENQSVQDGPTTSQDPSSVKCDSPDVTMASDCSKRRDLIASIRLSRDPIFRPQNLVEPSMNQSICPICESSDRVPFNEKGGRTLLICRDCRHISWERLPTEAELTHFYQKEYTDQHQQFDLQMSHASYYRSHVAELALLANVEIDRIAIADVGSSFPVFVEQAVALGCRCAIAVDWSQDAAEYGRKIGVAVATPDEFEQEVPNASLDVLRYSHTLEHLIDPVGTLKRHLLKVKPGGLVYITQPNFPVFKAAFFAHEILDQVWPTHLHYFCPASTQALLERCRLDLLRFYTVSNAEKAEAKYKEAFDAQRAGLLAEWCSDKGESVRGALSNFPYFYGENSAIYTTLRPDQGGVKSASYADTMTAIDRFLVKQPTAQAQSKPSAPVRSASAVAQEIHQQRVLDLLLDAAALQARTMSVGKHGRYKLTTDNPLAGGSADHLHPRGTANDDTRHPRFVRACEKHFNGVIRHLDIGCAGGGLVWDFLLAGHRSVGLEGSDFPLVNQKAYWRVIPDNLFTADATEPYIFRDGEGTPAEFDVITAWEVLEHIPETSIPGFFKNICVHLAPGGMFVCSIATFPDEDNSTGAVWHITVKPREWWVSIFQSNGLEVTGGQFGHHDFVRGSGNPRAHDWDAIDNPELGFHLVARLPMGSSG